MEEPFVINDDATVDEAFIIDNDVKAEWALNKIRERAAERDRIVSASQGVIDTYQAIIDKENKGADEAIAFMEGLLLRYFGTVEHKATKTQETYRLPTGRLKMKLATETMEPDKEELMKVYPDFVEQKPSLQWGELKKRLQIVDGKVIDTETGEIVQDVTVESTPPKFSVEV